MQAPPSDPDPRPIGWLRHSFLPPSETFIYTSLRSLTDRGVPVNVLALNRFSAQKFPYDAVTTLASGPWGLPEKALYWFTGASPRQRRWARSVSLIHAHMGYNGVYGLRAARRFNLPLVTSYYGRDVTLGRTLTRFAPSYLPYALFRRRLFCRGDRFLVLSDEMRRDLVSQGCPDDKLRIVRLGVDLRRFTVGARDRAAATGPCTVLMVGREIEKKGFADGLRACAAAIAQGADLRVVILGTGGELAPELQRLAASLRLDVAWLDPSTSVPATMADADVLLVPSCTARNGDKEGTPTVICEGSAAGLPIVATRHAGIPEQVDHEFTGLLAPEHGVDDLAAALVRLAASPGQRADLGRRGREKMLREYSLDAHCDGLLSVYRELLPKNLLPHV